MMTDKELNEREMKMTEKIEQALDESLKGFRALTKKEIVEGVSKAFGMDIKMSKAHTMNEYGMKWLAIDFAIEEYIDANVEIYLSNITGARQYFVDTVYVELNEWGE